MRAAAQNGHMSLIQRAGSVNDIRLAIELLRARNNERAHLAKAVKRQVPEKFRPVLRA
jgi:hypothetical protein